MGCPLRAAPRLGPPGSPLRVAPPQGDRPAEGCVHPARAAPRPPHTQEHPPPAHTAAKGSPTPELSKVTEPLERQADIRLTSASGGQARGRACQVSRDRGLAVRVLAGRSSDGARRRGDALLALSARAPRAGHNVAVCVKGPPGCAPVTGGAGVQEICGAGGGGRPLPARRGLPWTVGTSGGPQRCRTSHPCPGGPRELGVRVSAVRSLPVFAETPPPAPAEVVSALLPPGVLPVPSRGFCGCTSAGLPNVTRPPRSQTAFRTVHPLPLA